MDEKHKYLGNFEKILKLFDEISIEKLFFLFFYFYYFNFFENLLLKIELSEITPFFNKNFFGFGGGGEFPPSPPGYALELHYSIFLAVEMLVAVLLFVPLPFISPHLTYHPYF